MAPIQLGVLKIYPFGLFFAVLLALFFIWSAWLMRKNGLNRELQPLLTSVRASSF